MSNAATVLSSVLTDFDVGPDIYVAIRYFGITSTFYIYILSCFTYIGSHRQTQKNLHYINKHELPFEPCTMRLLNISCYPDILGNKISSHLQRTHPCTYT